MKEKIIARLRALFPGVNLSKARLDAICNADKLKINDDTEETEIDQKLKDLNDLLSFSDIARNDDRLRTLEAKEKKDPNKEDKSSNQEPEKPSEDKSDISKLLQDALAPLLQEINGLKAGKTADTRKQSLEAVIKDFPEAYKSTVLKGFTRSSFESDEDFAAYVEEVKADGAAFSQSLSDQGLGQSQKPFQPAGTGATQSAIKSDIEGWAKSNAPAEAGK